MATTRTKAPDADTKKAQAEAKAAEDERLKAEATAAKKQAAEDAPSDKAASYRVLKGITVGNGQTFVPGDTLEIAANDPEWPARRPGQLVKQGCLSPLEG